MKNKTVLHSSTSRRIATFAVALLALFSVAVVAQAEISGKENVLVKVSGALKPRALPRIGSAPVSVGVGGQISTKDGSEPPQVRELQIEINREGHFHFTGLPTCQISQLQAASNARALANCRAALVGEGRFAGTITLPSTEPYPIAGRLLVFNGTEHGKPTLLGHIYTPHPFGTSFVIRFKFAKRKGGTYGTVLTANLAEDLGKERNLIEIEMKLSRRFGYRGHHESYLTAGCPAPKGFPSATYKLARTTFAFASGINVSTVLNRTCRVRG